MDQTGVMRYNYNDPVLGTCKQSLLGGNHFRYWQQLPSRAYFLAASFEQNLTLNHMIERPDGYDHGRDSIVANATRSGGARSPLSSVVYDTTVEMVSGEGYLTPNSSRGVNHGIVTDGRVAVLTVTVREGTTATTGAIAAPPASTGSVLVPSLSPSFPSSPFPDSSNRSSFPLLPLISAPLLFLLFIPLLLHLLLSSPFTPFLLQ